MKTRLANVIRVLCAVLDSNGKDLSSLDLGFNNASERRWNLYKNETPIELETIEDRKLLEIIKDLAYEL